MNKKRIIIIAVVVVALYVLYKKGVFASLLGSKSDDSKSTDTIIGSDKNDTNSLIEATSMTADQQRIAKGWVRTIKNAIESGTNGWSKVKVMEKAESAEITYEQQLVVEAIWQMCVTQKQLTEKQRDNFINEVKGN